KIPTCHRSSFECVMDDSNLEQALENADAVARRVYRDEAKAIEELRKGIIEISGKEEPYDIFICYKETAENGERTIDSVIAQDVYDALVEKGYRVFFSRITLEDKLGQEYEPYIFAALHSAKIMLAFGTDYEYYNAVWVKNEWSRFLQLIAAGEKKTLIPCYKGIDAYDMPKEFARLQAQDMGKVGAMQDLLRGIEKILPREKAETMGTVVAQQNGNNSATAPLLKRVFMFLEDGDWTSADQYCEKVLDLDPECAEAYLGKLLVALEIGQREELKECKNPFDEEPYYGKMMRFASDALKKEISGYLEHIALRNNMDEYNRAKNRMEQANSADEYEQAAELFAELGEFKDSVALAEECRHCAKEWQYNLIKNRMEQANSADEYEQVAELFAEFGEFKDAVVLAEECHRRAEEARETFRREMTERAEKMRVMAGKIKIIQKLFQKCALSERIAGGLYMVGLKSDGTVAAVGANSYGRCNVAGWTNIIAVSTGLNYTAGLKSDGTVVATGDNYYGQCDVAGWTDIIAIAAANDHMVGLRSDGTVVATGSNVHGQCNVSGWRDIIAIAADGSRTVGLRSNGTVVAVGYNKDGSCNVSGWRDIVAVTVEMCHTVGLKSDGTVVAVGENKDGLCNVSGWRDIVAVAASTFHTVGLRSDGTVVAVGHNSDGRCNVSGWTDIVAVTAGGGYTAGLKSDGTVVVAELDGDSKRAVRSWTDIVAITDICGVVGLKIDGTVVTSGMRKSGWKLFESLEKELEASLRANEVKRSKLQTERSELQA
ncbi:MAG: TIR domain-containing protein, partial [Clostridia bacterium]|nr:TIR domain-containing protein [Clostridia bacterium]